MPLLSTFHYFLQLSTDISLKYFLGDIPMTMTKLVTSFNFYGPCKSINLSSIKFCSKKTSLKSSKREKSSLA